MRNPSTRTISIPAILGLVSMAAASCAQVDAEIPETKVTQKGVIFQGVPAVPGGAEVSVTESFTMTADDLSWTKDLNSDIYAFEVELKAVSGVQDLGFIHYARITMSAGGDPTVAPIEVVNYTRPESYTPSLVLDVPTTHPINVTSVWAADKVVFTIYLTGIFPEQDWAADLILHLSGKISYKF